MSILQGLHIIDIRDDEDGTIIEYEVTNSETQRLLDEECERRRKSIGDTISELLLEAYERIKVEDALAPKKRNKYRDWIRQHEDSQRKEQGPDTTEISS